MINKLNISLLTMFGIGESVYAPGTIASLVTCLIYIFCFNFGVNIAILISINFIICTYSIIVIDKYARRFENIDAKEIVIDEFIGQSIPLLSIYAIFSENFYGQFIIFTFVSFLSFRFFDIIKPFPINMVDKKMKNGFGVLLDDIIAGIFSSILILILLFFISDV